MPQLQLTLQEEALIEKYREFFQSLETGRRKPTTDAQAHFVAVCRGHSHAETEHEKAYAKLMRIRAIQRREQYHAREAQGGISEYEDGYPHPGWFTDEDWKKLRRQDFADMNQRRRER